MAVIYGFRNKLECLSLDQAGKACQGQTLQLIMETVNYGRNKFYDTGPWTDSLSQYICTKVCSKNNKSFIKSFPDNPFKGRLVVL